MIYIGIDPGVKTGIAAIVPPNKFINTMPIHQAFGVVDAIINTSISKVHVRVEDARQRKWFGNNSQAKLQGAGSIKRDCKIWEDFLKDHSEDSKGNITFEMVHPVKGGTKINSNLFKKITGIDDRTSEHARDAYMLIHNYKKL